jgi:hypothetical protein
MRQLALPSDDCSQTVGERLNVNCSTQREHYAYLCVNERLIFPIGKIRPPPGGNQARTAIARIPAERRAAWN